MTTDSNSSNPRRRPKGDKRQRTRAALLAAAREVVHEKGFERLTMDAVAQRAGMTSGALYGNFKNRDDLLVALSDRIGRQSFQTSHQGRAFIRRWLRWPMPQ